MAKTKIFHLITSLNIGGTEKVLLTVLKNLKEKYDFSVGYLKERGRLAEEITGIGIPVEKYNFFSLAKYLRKNKIDILHTHLYRANILGRISGRFSGVPVIISSQRSIDGWKKLRHAWLDGITSLFCNLIIANSNAAKNILITREHISAKKIKVVYNGTANYNPSGKPHPPFKKDRPVIGYVGRLHKEKGVYLIPDIIKKVAGNNPKVKFVIAGDGPEMNNLKSKISGYNLNDYAEFTGFSGILENVYYKIDVLLLPSEEESFPQAALEAMSYGVPVIASDVGGLPELVEDKKTGILIKTRTPDEFAKAILSVLNDQYSYQHYSENSKIKAASFTIEKMINSIDGIYEGFIKK